MKYSYNLTSFFENNIIQFCFRAIKIRYQILKTIFPIFCIMKRRNHNSHIMNYSTNYIFLYFCTWKTKRIDWWATAIQFVGTFFFNISTFNANFSNLSTTTHHVVWSPDVYSICFLVASLLA